MLLFRCGCLASSFVARLLPVILLLVGLSHRSEAQQTINYGNWQGGAYYDETSQVFSHCWISAPYLSGDLLVFALQRDGRFSVGVSNPQWNMPSDAEYSLVLIIDNKQRFSGTARVVEPTQ